MNKKTRREFIRTSGALTGVGLITSAGVGKVTAQSTIPISWESNTGTPPISIAAEDEVANAVYTLSEQTGTLFKISTSTGEVIWSISRPLSDGSEASFRINFGFDSDSGKVTIEGDSGYLITDSTIYAVSLATGDEQWQFSGEFSFLQRVTEGTVYIQDSPPSGSLKGLDPQMGEEELLIESELSATRVTSEAAYVVDNSGTISRFNNTNATEQWSTSYGQRAPNELNEIYEITDTAVYASVNGIPRKVDANTGEKIWSLASMSSRPRSADLAENRLITVSDGGALSGVDAETGAVEWTVQPDSSFLFYDVNVERGNQLYLEADDRSGSFSIFQIDPTNGNINWSFTGQGNSPFSFVNPDNQLIISAVSFDDNRGIVYGVNSSTGTEKWQASSNGFGIPFEINDIGYIADQSEVLGIDLADGSTIVSRSFDEPVSIDRITNETVYLTSRSTAYGLDADSLGNDGSGAPPTGTGPSPSVRATVQQAGTPGSQARVEYVLANVSGQSSVGLEFETVPSALSINPEASDTAGIFDVSAFLFSAPSGELTPTIAFDIAADLSPPTTVEIDTAVLDETGTTTDRVTTALEITADSADSPLGGTAGEYDTSGDGTITARELGAAVTDFGQGELNARELGEVVTAFGQS